MGEGTSSELLPQPTARRHHPPTAGPRVPAASVRSRARAAVETPGRVPAVRFTTIDVPGYERGRTRRRPGNGARGIHRGARHHARARPRRDAALVVRHGGRGTHRRPPPVARHDVQVGDRAHRARRRQVGDPRAPRGEVAAALRGDGALRRPLRRLHHRGGRQRRRRRPPRGATVDALRLRPHAEEGGGGDPGPYTAYGTYLALRETLRAATGSDSLDGRTVALQGAGSVGLASHSGWRRWARRSSSRT